MLYTRRLPLTLPLPIATSNNTHPAVELTPGAAPVMPAMSDLSGETNALLHTSGKPTISIGSKILKTQPTLLNKPQATDTEPNTPRAPKRQSPEPCIASTGYMTGTDSTHETPSQGSSAALPDNPQQWGSQADPDAYAAACWAIHKYQMVQQTLTPCSETQKPLENPARCANASDSKIEPCDPANQAPADPQPCSPEANPDAHASTCEGESGHRMSQQTSRLYGKTQRLLDFLDRNLAALDFAIEQCDPANHAEQREFLIQRREILQTMQNQANGIPYATLESLDNCIDVLGQILQSTKMPDFFLQQEHQRLLQAREKFAQLKTDPRLSLVID